MTWGKGDGSTDGNGNNTTNLTWNQTGIAQENHNVSPRLMAWRDWAALANTSSGVSLSAAPPAIPAGHVGNITITLTGTGTTWTAGTTVFSISGVSGVTKVSQSIASTTSATLIVSTSSGTGILTISDGIKSTTITVSTASLAVSPATVGPSATTSIAVTGTSTVWLQETPSTLFSESGLSGASITSIVVTTNTTATFSFTTGATLGTATITDNSDGQTTTITCCTNALFYRLTVNDPSRARRKYHAHADRIRDKLECRDARNAILCIVRHCWRIEDISACFVNYFGNLDSDNDNAWIINNLGWEREHNYCG